MDTEQVSILRTLADVDGDGVISAQVGLTEAAQNTALLHMPPNCEAVCRSYSCTCLKRGRYALREPLRCYQSRKFALARVLPAALAGS